MSWKTVLQVCIMFTVASFCGIIIMLVHRGDTEDAMTIMGNLGGFICVLGIMLGVGLFFKKMMDDL